MKLIQLNLWSGRLTSPLAQFLKKEQPDILCAQEAMLLPGGDGIIFLTNEEIQKLIHTEQTFLSPVFSFNFMRRKVDFGNAIFSHFPFSKTETIFTHREYLDNLDVLEDSPNMRNLQHAILSLPENRQVHVLNHHGYHLDHHKNGDAESLRQCKLIADYVRSLDGPIILTGDFNLVPESESIGVINKVLRNLITESAVTTTRNILTHKTEICDYIFVNDRVKVKKFAVAEEIVSDHQPLILEFEIE